MELPDKLKRYASLPVPQNAHAAINPAVVYLSSLKGGDSRRTMLSALNVIAEIVSSGEMDALNFPWGNLRYHHTQAIRGWLAEHYAPSTANKMLSALRRVLKEAWRLGYMSSEEFNRAADIQNVGGSVLPAGRSLIHGEIAALISACAGEKSPVGIRDAAIIAVLYSCGLRRAEIVELNLSDYDRRDGRLVVRGKRRKERAVFVRGGAQAALHDWLAVRGDDPGALFYPSRRGGHLKKRGMTTQAIYNILKKRAEEAGVRDFSPHDLRRTFVGDLLDAGADIVTVQKLAGHANPHTTSRYDRRPEDAKRKAQEMLHVPYHAHGSVRDE